MLSSGQNTVKVPLTQGSSDKVSDKIQVVVKSLGRDEVKVGSISIPQDLFFSGGVDSAGKYSQWITLFDHIDDDEYDGDLGENDEDAPRIQFQFHI